MELLEAAKAGDEKACERLLEAGVDPNYRKSTVSVGYLLMRKCFFSTSYEIGHRFIELHSIILKPPL